MNRPKAGVFVMALLVLALAPPVRAENVILYDFEESVEGWENEASNPVPAKVTSAKTHHGKGALAFTKRFGKNSPMLHCRVKEGFPRDVSGQPEFQGFSAWVYVPNGRPFWEIKMFVRSGQRWEWGTGKSRQNLEPGWYRVEIRRADILNPADIQDLGLNIMNFAEDIESTVVIDQVEMITSPDNPKESSR